MHFTRVFALRQRTAPNQTASCSHASAAKGATACKAYLQRITYPLIDGAGPESVSDAGIYTHYSHHPHACTHDHPQRCVITSI